MVEKPLKARDCLAREVWCLVWLELLRLNGGCRRGSHPDSKRERKATVKLYSTLDKHTLNIGETREFWKSPSAGLK